MTVAALLLLGFVTAIAVLARSAVRITEHLVEDEIKARLPYAASKVLDQAIEVLPADLQEDRRREWLAELASLEGQPLHAMWTARQFFRAALTEAEEQEAEFAGSEAANDVVLSEMRGDSHRRDHLQRQDRIHRTQLAVAFAGHAVTTLGVTVIMVLTFAEASVWPPILFLTSELAILALCTAGLLDLAPLMRGFEGVLFTAGSRLVKTLDIVLMRFRVVALMCVCMLQFVALGSLLDATGGPTGSPFAPFALAIPIATAFLARRWISVALVMAMSMAVYESLLVGGLASPAERPPPISFLSAHLLLLVIAMLVFAATRRRATVTTSLHQDAA
jgi:hypothetical protein